LDQLVQVGNSHSLTGFGVSAALAVLVRPSIVLVVRLVGHCSLRSLGWMLVVAELMFEAPGETGRAVVAGAGYHTVVVAVEGCVVGVETLLSSGMGSFGQVVEAEEDDGDH
jgi:hypothetical protein